MSVKNTARIQYVRLIDQSVDTLNGLADPPEGWIACLRKALGLSAAKLARRAGITRAAIYQAERSERDGGISLRQLHKLADASNARVVYAIVPRQHVDTVIEARATRKAEALIKRVSAHMALESQALTREQNRREIVALRDEFVRNMPTDFWDDP